MQSGIRSHIAVITACGLAFASSRTAFAEKTPQSIVDLAMAEMSVGRTLQAVSTITVAGREILYDVVENDHPGAPYYVYFSDIRRSTDLSSERQRTDSVSTTGKTSVILTPNLSVAMSGEGPAAKRAASAPPPSWMTQDPIQALRMARAASDLKVEQSVTWHEARQQVVSFHNGPYRVRLLIDSQTGLPSATEALVSFDRPASSGVVAWDVWGDVVERTEYMNWTVVDGIRYPYQWDVFRNGALFRTVAIAEAHVDTPIDPVAFAVAVTDVADPLSIEDLPLGRAVSGAPAPNKPIVEIARDIIQIPNSWYSTLVRQKDGIVVIDAPISAGYSKQVLKEAARRFPGIPVKALITSTGFFWHIAGVREYAARGIPIYAEPRNAELIQKMLAAPHSLVPDDLSKTHHPPPVVIPVFTRLTIGKGANVVAVMPIRKGTGPMLMTYIKDAKLLHTGEMVQPFGPNEGLLYPESLIELTEQVREEALDVAQIIGMHMSPTPWSKVGDTLKEAGVRI